MDCPVTGARLPLVIVSASTGRAFHRDFSASVVGFLREQLVGGGEAR